MWGLTRFDAQAAEQDGRLEADRHNWDVVAVESSSGPPNPIRRRDWKALARGTKYNRAWAAYSLDGEDDEQARGNRT